VSSADLAKVAEWTQQNQPQAFGYAAAKYQQEPDILSSLLGNKALMSAVMAIGASFLQSKMK
jgi:hypothetical protein